MCLIVDRKQCPNGYKIAKKNIPCYKVLLKTSSGRFETPHMRKTVNTKTSIEADSFQKNPNMNEYIKKGIHSCTNLERAYMLQNAYFNSINNYVYCGVVIQKAYIPKGTKYWVGENHEFCSERIVFAEK